MRAIMAAVLALAAAPQAALGQSLDRVSAEDPEGMVRYLEITGFEPKLEKDDLGDPKIRIRVNDYSATIYFYGCDETTHRGCDSVQLQSAFDRKDPWPPAEAIKVAERWRYGAVWLDKEGDPVVSWDIITGDGIPSKVFLKALNAFGDTLHEVAGMVFPADGSQNTGG